MINKYCLCYICENFCTDQLGGTCDYYERMPFKMFKRKLICKNFEPAYFDEIDIKEYHDEF